MQDESIRAELHENGVRLCFEEGILDQRANGDHVLLLTPPMAVELARLLDKAVHAYDQASKRSTPPARRRHQ